MVTELIYFTIIENKTTLKGEGMSVDNLFKLVCDYSKNENITLNLIDLSKDEFLKVIETLKDDKII